MVPISSSCSTDQSSDPFEDPALSTTIPAHAHAFLTAAIIRLGSSGTISEGRKVPPHASTFTRTTKLFDSTFLPAGTTADPAGTNSLPVGINATRGLRRTATLATFPPAIRAATSGVMISPAFANTSPGFKREPIAEVPANCADGAASISTRCSSSETTTCLITIAVSNPSGIATPVLANSQSLPRTHPDVSGIPSTKSDQCTAIESIRHVNAFGSMHADATPSSKTRPNDSSRRTISVLGEKLQAAKRPDTTSSHEIWICLEWSLIFRPFMQTPQRETRCGVCVADTEMSLYLKLVGSLCLTA